MSWSWLRRLASYFNFWKDEPLSDLVGKNERVAMSEVKRHEGFWGLTPEGPRLNALTDMGTSGYYDSEGFLTNGIGHRVPGVPKHPEHRNIPVPGFDLTWEQTDDQFEKDFVKHLEFAKRSPGWDKASDRQKRGLINLTFNMGAGWWAENPDRETNKAGWPRFRAAAEDGDWHTAAKELVDSKWYRQTGDRASEVISLMKPEIQVGMLGPMDRVGGTGKQGVMGSVGRPQ